MVNPPVLVMPNFSEEFIVETDTLGIGIGAVLMQGGHPIAFISKALSLKHQALSVYEKELLAIVYAVTKWHHYLNGRHFSIKTDHQSLKHLLQQRINFPAQHAWLTKLMGYDYDISYKRGRENVVAYALSRMNIGELLSLAVSSISVGIMEQIQKSWETDPHLVNLIQQLKGQEKRDSPYSWKNDQLIRRGRLVVGSDRDLQIKLIKLFHEGGLEGPSGMQATLKRISTVLFWKGMERQVRNFIRGCDICQRFKYDNTASPGLLQPLPIPSTAWTQVTMDFIEGLPHSGGVDVILVVVDRLTKYAHFMGLKHPYTAVTVAKVYINQVFKLHGLPTSIVSDRDPVFTSIFWQEMFKIQGVNLQLSTAYHPQTDGQSEVVNRCLETYLRCVAGDQLKTWFRCLSLAEWWYNSTYHTSIHTTPFEALYGYPPPIHLPYFPGTSLVNQVHLQLEAREEMLHLLKHYLK